MSWWKTEFDKLLVAFYVLILCGLSLLGNEKLATFALVAASNFTGCLLTLVVAKRDHGDRADPHFLSNHHHLDHGHEDGGPPA